MSDFTDLFGSAGMKPKRVTTLTSGTGTFTPLVSGGLIRITVQAAGGGGNATNTSTATAALGGGGGCAFQGMVRFYGPAPYSVGAAPAANQPAPPTRIGSIYCGGGQGGSPSIPGVGGAPLMFALTSSSPTASEIISAPGYIPGGRGGDANSSYAGFAAGMPFSHPSFTTIPASSIDFSKTGSTAIGSPNYQSLQGAGGDSLLGQGSKGSVTTTAAVTIGSGYGYGGAGGGPNSTLNAGGPAIIIIEEFGI